MTDLDLAATTVAIAAQGLVGAAVDLPRGPLSDVSWTRVMHDVRCHGLEAHLTEAIFRGCLRATDGQREQAQRAQQVATARALLLHEELLRCVDLLGEAGIDYRLFKGLALAHLVYPNPALRSLTAIDLIVPAQDLDAAVGALMANGAERAQPLRHGFNRRFGKTVGLKLLTGLHLDLHRTLAHGPFGKRVDSAALFETRTTFEVDGRTLLALGLEELLIQSCYSAVLSDDPPRLVALRDIAELCLSGGIDPRRVEMLAARWSGIAVLSRGIALAWETFRLADVVPLSVLASRYLPTRRERRLLGTYAAGKTLPAALASLPLISGVTDKQAYIGALASPASSRFSRSNPGPRAWVGQALGRLATKPERRRPDRHRRKAHLTVGGES